MKHQAEIHWKELSNGRYVCHTRCAFQWSAKGMGGMSEDSYGCSIGCLDPKEFDAAPDKTKCPGPGPYSLKRMKAPVDEYIEKTQETNESIMNALGLKGDGRMKGESND